LNFNLRIENCSKLIFSHLFDRKNHINEALFFPDKQKEYDMIKYLKFAQKYCYIAVYTISNDNLAGVVYSLLKKGVDVRIITDDETMTSNGSDIINLANAGVPIRTDRDLAARMHHKFVVIDDEVLLNGSFNWTYTAVTSNNENIVATSDAKLIKEFKTVGS
jgi:mitochondrial cardiolipin hydrolase